MEGSVDPAFVQSDPVQPCRRPQILPPPPTDVLDANHAVVVAAFARTAGGDVVEAAQAE